ncbi:unnamed protein product, partial [marine sediment metagenome]
DTLRDKKERSRFLSEKVKLLQETNNKEWEGWRGKVLVVKETKEGKMFARNTYYKPIILPKGNLGERVEVEIKECSRNALFGEIVESIAQEITL